MEDVVGLLDGRNVVVTGAGRGIGAAIARLAGQEGACVVVNDLDLAPAEEVVADIRAAGGRAVAHVADIVEWDGAGSVIDRCVDEFGSIDGLVANAGMFYMSLPAEQRPDDFRRMIEFNSVAVAYPGLHAIRRMTAQGSGSIVNVTSSSAGGLAAMSAYGASKGAVLSLTVGWALDLQSSGVRVNGLSPIAMTRMHEWRMDYEQIPDDERAAVRAARHVDPEFNAPPAVFLLSDRSSHVTGQILQIERGSRLGMLAHPHLVGPTVTVRQGSLDDVESAFRDTFDAQLQPFGTAALPVPVSQRG
jgi:NAD(P)-dependent dehydrogenase (short-subunit alcohol dehydrogenase family)